MHSIEVVVGYSTRVDEKGNTYRFADIHLVQVDADVIRVGIITDALLGKNDKPTALVSVEDKRIARHLKKFCSVLIVEQKKEVGERYWFDAMDKPDYKARLHRALKAAAKAAKRMAKKRKKHPPMFTNQLHDVYLKG